jgi:hypothetical protein
MRRKSSFDVAGWALVIVASGFLFCEQARADDTFCFSKAVAGQQAQRLGHLLEARDDFQACAQVACDPKVIERCTGWLADVEASLPTITAGARDAAGQDLPDVAVFVDGRPFVGASRGAELAIDPGPHVVRFERKGQSPVEQSIVTREHEKGRSVIAVLAPGQPDLDAGGGRRPLPTEVFVFAGVAVASAITWGYFSISGLSQRSEQGCGGPPGCAASAGADVTRRLVVGDIAGGVTVLAAAAAAWFYFTRPAAGDHSARVGIAPFVGPGAGGVAVTF